MNEKGVFWYPIAKNRVVGVTRMTDLSYDTLVDYASNHNGYIYNYDLNPWTLTQDDHFVAANLRDNLLIAHYDDTDYFFFICY